LAKDTDWDKSTLVVVATDRFGVGIDSSDVRHVVVAGCSRSLVDMWQVIGRVGRDGSAGEAVILFHPAHARRTGVDDPRGQLRLEQFMTWAEDESSCRLRSIEAYLGSNGAMEDCWMRKSSNGGPVEICDVCAMELARMLVSGTKRELFGDNPSTEPSEKRRKVDKGRAEQLPSEGPISTPALHEEIALLRSRARKFSDHCVSCLVSTRKRDSIPMYMPRFKT